MSQSVSSPVIALRDLRFAWPGAAEPTLQIAALELQAGETAFLQGASGGGKSTLLALLAGVLAADAGSVQLQGRDWATLRGAARDRARADSIGIVFQQFNLLPYLPVIDNVLLPCRFSALRAQRAGPNPRAAAERLLDRMGLASALWTRPAAQLSVGQQQRVAAARALIGRPEVVIADEPTSALDAALRDSFMDLLLDACRASGGTLVFVSHDERLAARFDERLSLSAINRAATSAMEHAA